MIVEVFILFNDDFPDIDEALCFTEEEIFPPEILLQKETLEKAKQEQQALLKSIDVYKNSWAIQEEFVTLIVTDLFKKYHIEKSVLEQQVTDTYYPLRQWFETSTLVLPVSAENDPSDLQDALTHTLQQNDILSKKVQDYSIGLNLYRAYTRALIIKLSGNNTATDNMNIINFPALKTCEVSDSDKENRKKVKFS